MVYAFILLFILGVIVGGILQRARTVYRSMIENRIRVRLEKTKLEETPTKLLSDEFFDREEAWDIVAEKAKKGL